MKYCLLLLLLLLTSICFSQTIPKVENIIIVTTDGFRWQEVFKGMDSVIAENPKFNQNKKEEIFKKYGSTSALERRKKLLPFMWNTISTQGQLYGNRAYGNKVDNANPYWYSYPGYSEIFCGYADTAVNSNNYKANPNTNLLEFINKQKDFNNKVAAFAAWSAFDRILNEQRSGFPVTCGSQSFNNNDAAQKLIGEMKRNSHPPYDTTAYQDVFTQYQAMDYLQKQQPRVLYISYGETDEWAHYGNYSDYLDAAHRVDKWLNDLWNYIQTSPTYKNKTALFITVDHGRGDSIKKEWTSHNSKIADSHQIWFAVMGPNIAPKGEMKTEVQIYQKQFAQTFADLLGLKFTCEHPVAPTVKEILEK